VSRHKQLTAASGPQVLPTSNVRGVDAAVFSCNVVRLVLRTSLNRKSDLARATFKINIEQDLNALMCRYGHNCCM